MAHDTPLPACPPRDAGDVPHADVAVVIPVFNRPQTVCEALASVCVQSLRPAEIVVVDDGSTDGTADAVRAWIAARGADGWIHLLEVEHGGAAQARNHGLERVPARRYVAFLDSDDLWPEDFLARTTRVLDRCPDAVAASCDRRRIREGEAREIHDPLADLARDPTGWLFRHGGGVLSCSLLRTRAVRDLGGFEAGLSTGHDSALLLRLSLRGAWHHAPGAPVTMRGGVSRARGERGHLRHVYYDYKRAWARVHERFILHQGGAEALPEPNWRRQLARYWYRAGLQLNAAGRPREARLCFGRSFRYRWMPFAILQWGSTWFRRRRADATQPSAEPSALSPASRGEPG